MTPTTRVIACVPSRGLLYSRTIDSILKNAPDTVIFAHEEPVPYAYNYLVEQALKMGATRLWFVDDDMLIPEGTLDSLKNMKMDIAFCDYPLEGGTAAKFHGKTFLFAGMGCVLAKASVFEEIRFRTDVGYKFPSMERITRNPQKHGGQDVDFFRQAIERGYTIGMSDITVGHLRSDVPHPKGNNTSYNVRGL